MGQRLNIEIVGKGGTVDNVLASCYYHWSGYTSSAAKLTSCILNEIKKTEIPNKAEDKIVYAIRLLESTKAGLLGNEINFASEKISNFDSSLFEIGEDRNKGLIVISDKMIAELRMWKEGRVQIDLDKRLVIFDTLLSYDKGDFIKEFSLEEFNNLEEHDFNCVFSAIGFEDFFRIESEFIELIARGVCDVRTPLNNVISFIVWLFVNRKL